jgi:uncharacterized repeat protein (TIGR01451 family)
VFVLESDLNITIDDNADPIQPGDQIVYTVTVENIGPTDATGVVADVVLDADTTLVSVDPPGVPNGANVQAVIGNLANSGSVVFTITVDTNTDRYLKARATVAGSGVEADPDASDNIEDEVTAVFANASGSPRIVISAINGHPTALAPDQGGREFDSISQPQASPNGQNWIMVADLDGVTSTDSVVVRSVAGVIEIVAQEGVTLDDLGITHGNYTADEALSINDSGNFALATNNSGSIGDIPNEIIVKNIGGVYSTVARGGQVNDQTFQLYSFDLRSPVILNNDRVWFYSLMGTDVNNITGRHIYEEDGLGGTIVQLQTLPNPNYVINGTGLPGVFYNSLDRGELSVRSDGSEFFVTGLGDDFILTPFDVSAVGTANAAPAATLNAAVEEGQILPGLASPVSDIQGSSDHTVNRMLPNGDWFVLGSNSDSSDWVVRNGSVLGATGVEIFAGAGESYDDTDFSSGFFLATGNGNGDFILGSLTDCRDSDSNAVLVLNNERIIAREHDPIDVDENGVYDDDAFIRSFGNHDIILTDDGIVYYNATLETATGALLGEALLTLNINCEAFGDINEDGLLNGLDVQGFTDCLLAGNPPAGICQCADLNGDGDVDDMDTAPFAALLLGQ